MDIYCTRPRCEQPVNSFADLDDSKLLKTVHQRHCVNCGMPLILDGRYLPTQLLQQGGLGVAFLGYDRRTPGLRRCVIKQLQVNPTFNAEQIETATKLFHREAEVLEKLGEHPRIPRLFAFLELIAAATPPYTQQKFFYLVQEYIEGHNLQQELQVRGRFTEPEVIYVLREVGKILEFIHFQGSIHRDIKPSNIMRDLKGQIYAIDFGAVKQIVMDTDLTAGGNLSTGVSTPEYAPWEQRQGSTIYPSSDLYALAVTCVNLLTGKPPQALLAPDTNAWQWRSADLQVSDGLAEILDKMLRHNPTERFQSARDVLEALDDIYGIPVVSIPVATLGTAGSVPVPTTLLLGTFEQEETLQIGSEMPRDRELVPPQIKAPILPETAPMQVYTAPQPKAVLTRDREPLAIWKIGAAALVGLSALLFSKLLPSSTGSLGEGLAQRSSEGDRILMSLEGNRDTDRFKSLKRAGVLAMANKKYDEAATHFQAALVENPNSPETRIYLNNALIGDRQSYTIATSAPIGRSLDRASEMLRGFAQAQSEINQAGGVNEAKIKLRIVDDGDDPKKIESIATDIAKQPEILGIVGHNRNDVTMAAANIYNREKLAFIAPISTANELTSSNKPYIFRTNARADKIVQKLVDRLIDKEGKRRVAIFSVPTITYNDEFKNQFANKLASKGGQIVGMFQFSTVASSASPPTATAPTFDAETYLQQANAAGAEAVLLLPVGRSQREAIQLLKIVARKYPRLSILSDTAMFNVNTLRAGKAATGLTIGVPWQESDSTPQFANGAQQLWRDRVNWATATSYNAVKSMGMAIKSENSPSRENVMTMLTKSDFTGASGRLQFTRGEPTENYALVQVAPTPPNYRYSSRTGYDFVPVE
jgi:ABC-type branched-subunit amino acid transport system substrate-binding protein/serine/threonine protein kinase